MEELILGIDLGTTNTVCYSFKNSLEVLKFRGKELLPSVLYYKDGKLVVGSNAKKKATQYPKNVIMSSKTFIGDDKKVWSIQDEEFTPTDVAKHILYEVVREAKKKDNVDKCKAVITVPEYFTSRQYKETREAAESAGIEVIELLSEPIAASIAYSMNEEKNKNIFVIDVGGGTFDVSILKIENNKFTTLSTGGNRKLGGDNFDQVIVNECMKKIRKENGINLSSLEKSGLDEIIYYQVMTKLLFECEKAKIELSSLEETDIIIPSLIPVNGDSINFNIHITRDEFDEKSENLLDEIELTIRTCLYEAKYEAEDIDKVIMVGGSSNIVAVNDVVKDIFNKNTYSDKDFSKLVAKGAAIKAAIESGYASTFVRDGEAPIIQDILSSSFGIALANKKYSIILEKGTEYPCESSRIYTTIKDFQECVKVQIYEGEDTENLENDNYYGSYEHRNIERALEGEPSIKVTFSFDKNKILNVSSVDLNTYSKVDDFSIDVK